MLTNSDIYVIMDKLGLVNNDDYDNCCACEDIPYVPLETRFEENSADLTYVFKFVDEIFLYNDQDTIKKFLVTLLFSNSKDNSKGKTK